MLIIIFTQEKDGRYSASVPALPGCFSQGDTLEEAKKNIEEAIELYMDDEDFDESILESEQIIAPIDLPLKR